MYDTTAVLRRRDHQIVEAPPLLYLVRLFMQWIVQRADGPMDLLSYKHPNKERPDPWNRILSRRRRAWFAQTLAPEYEPRIDALWALMWPYELLFQLEINLL